MKKKMTMWIKVVCIALCVMIVIPCVFISCSDNKDEIVEKARGELIGTWNASVSTGYSIKTHKFTFSNSGNVSYLKRDTSSYSSSGYDLTGTYVVEYIGDELVATITWDADSLGYAAYYGVENKVNLIYNEDNGNLSVIFDDITFTK